MKNQAFHLVIVTAALCATFALSIVDFDLLNPGQSAEVHNTHRIDTAKSEEESMLIEDLEKELQIDEGSFDIGVSSSLKDSEILDLVSKDPTIISGQYKSHPHDPHSFKDKTLSEQFQSSTSSTMLFMETTLTSSSETISELATPSTNARISVSKTVTISTESITSASTKIFDENPLDARGPSESLQEVFPFTAISVSSKSATTSKSPQPAARPEVQPPFVSVIEMLHTSVEPLETESVVLTGSSTHLGEGLKEEKESVQSDIDQASDLEAMGITQTIKDSIDKYMKEILDSKPIFSQTGRPESQHALKTEQEAPIHSTITTSLLVEPTGAMPKSQNLQENLVVDYTPIITSTLSFADPKLQPSTTDESRPISTEILSAKAPASENGDVHNTSPTESEIWNFMNDKLGYGETDLDGKKLKDILDVLLRLKTAASSGTSIEDINQTPLPESIDNSAQSPQPEDIDVSTESLVGSHDDHSESQELANLEILGLKEVLKESQTPGKGSFLKKLKDVPQNLFDLVDRRYGDELSETESKSAKKSHEAQKNHNSPKGKPKSKQKYNVSQKTEGKKTHKVNPMQKQKPHSDSRGSDAGFKEHSSLKKILKDKKKLSPSKEHFSLHNDDQEDEEYKKLSQGKVIFGFDKKKKIGMKKFKLGDEEEEDSDLVGEVEYYEPEKFLFDKASVYSQSTKPNSKTNVDDADEENNAKAESESFEGLDSSGENSTSTRTKEAHQISETLNNVFDVEFPSKVNTVHNDPYSIPKGPAEVLKNLGNLKESISSTEKSSPTKSTKSEVSSNNQSDKYKKIPSLLFNEKKGDESLFDFTRSEANSIKLMSWSIMGAAILVATSVMLV